MTSIIKKIKKGHPYYYAVESQRVDGKPRIVWQKYLGKVEDIISSVDSSDIGNPTEVEVGDFGAIAALMTIAKDLDLKNLINSEVSKRSQGASLGEYIILAAINRTVDPKSKLAMEDWYEKTFLKPLWKRKKGTFSSQNFWQAMSHMSEESIIKIEDKLVNKILSTYDLDLNTLLFDNTNFTTFISSTNNRSEIPQRGNSKKKRRDLKIINFSLIVSKEDKIPFFHRVYEGDIDDKGNFRNSILQIIERKKQIRSFSGKELTLVFDKGNLVSECILLIDQNKFGFVSSLRFDQCHEVWAKPRHELKPLKSKKFSGFRTYRDKLEILDGIVADVLLVYSEKKFAVENYQLTEDLSRAINKLDVEAKKISRKKHLSNSEQQRLEVRIEKIFSQHRIMKRLPKKLKKYSIIDTEITIDETGSPSLSYAINQEALDRRIEDCGKTILFTNRENWEDEEIIETYRSQIEIENTFKDMNNRDFLRWQPMFHWTDQKIRVHGFICYLALLITRLAELKVKNDVYCSTDKFLSMLADIKEVLLMYPSKNQPAPPKIRRTYSKLSPDQKKLHDLLNLSQWQKK